MGISLIQERKRENRLINMLMAYGCIDVLAAYVVNVRYANEIIKFASSGVRLENGQFVFRV